MPFFNFRRGSSSQAANQAIAPESAETLRRRAKHRLIGSAVLVLAGVIGFPLVFDTQPRPVAGDIAIEIPGKTVVKPLALPSPPTSALSPAVVAVPTPPAQIPVATTNRVAGEKVSVASSLTPEEEVIASKPVLVAANKASAATRPEPKPVLPPSVKPTTKAEAKAEAKTEAKAEARVSGVDEAARARALLNGTTLPPPTAVGAAAQTGDATGRFIVQVGAFAEVAKAREARLKVESAGLKTYTQVAETTAGKRIRVRVGPFSSRADADRAASKIKTLGLSASILTL